MAGQSDRAQVESSAPRPATRPPRPPFYLPLNATLYLCLIVNGLAALYSPIQDCDEVFNFWEPTHYISHGYGLQTWEYSPVYSIRSWLYVSLHAAIGKLGSLIVPTKAAEFYFIRCGLAVFCAACQTRLYSSICRTLNPRIGLLFILIALFSPGIFHASTAFLPSTFTMYTGMLGLSAFLDLRDSHKTAQGIMWFGLGSIVGWPFAGALMVPLLLEELILSVISQKLWPFVVSVVDGGLRCLAILALEVAVDYVFFRKIALVPWNIVAYNIFGGQGRGPEIFGVEPWTFYMRNLLLNFNVWFLLAMLSAPLVLLQAVLRHKDKFFPTLIRSIALVAPFYMWFAIFTIQPHKEERFMYPAYPFLALNAALAFHLALTLIGSGDPQGVMRRVPAKLKLGAVLAMILLAINAGMLRTLGMVTAYSAPLNVLEPLQRLGTAREGAYVCLGKEWYRFPSSYLLPQNMRAKFIRSEFQGLLPGEFPEATDLAGRVGGASQIPSGMNDLNIEDPSKYVDISQCSFLVDSSFPGRKPTELEPDYVQDKAHWDVLSCEKFLDASQTSLVGRLIWLPNLPIVPEKIRRRYGQYCLLQRRGSEERV
ncbi:putative Dol-P-Man alpha-mannosyltransferase [Penicillium oxalicum 114-2]|uniref:Mannosyltransferase n=1 Tax=Penicillium oxalicum (strain 114-2 / CGMCC 5302) TaxID=933388 RepID=S8AU09_PENO1|nr:putative Dol-P-Man alpha-mannosyltransferase [Penicillium oxalicum 114-2]